MYDTNIAVRRGFMLTIYQLMEYLKNTHHIDIDPKSQLQSLRNIGYYHGFKGYRFVREDANRIMFASFDEVVALNDFDMRLKTILYPAVMFIENALKSYVIEALLNDCKSENFDDIYNKSLTAYKSYKSGSSAYKNAYIRRMNLKGRINSALIRDYTKRSVVAHFFNNDKSIPVWAIFETLTLGEFGMLYECANIKVKKYVSNIMSLPTNLDSDGMITKSLIYAIKDLRNAIAHNNVIFDTRFKTGKVDSRLSILLETEMSINNIDFKYMDAYVAAITYFLSKMGASEKMREGFVEQYDSETERLRKKLPVNICSKILGTQHKSNMKLLKDFIKK